MRDGRTNEQGKIVLLSQCNGCWMAEFRNKSGTSGDYNRLLPVPSNHLLERPPEGVGQLTMPRRDNQWNYFLSTVTSRFTYIYILCFRQKVLQGEKLNLQINFLCLVILFEHDTVFHLQAIAANYRIVHLVRYKLKFTSNGKFCPTEWFFEVQDNTQSCASYWN